MIKFNPISGQFDMVSDLADFVESGATLTPGSILFAGATGKLMLIFLGMILITF
jgi:hypothetical protein